MPEQMPRCETCKHWGTAGNYTKDGSKECKRIPAGSEHDGNPAFPAFTWYDDSALCTSPDFGCTLHEPRSET